MQSPLGGGQPHHRLSGLYLQVALYAGGHCLAVAVLCLLWFSWRILAGFQAPLVWAWLCSLSLRDVKRWAVVTARRELARSSFLVCCGKLAFLPGVILWQLAEEVQEQLLAKFHELQSKSQEGATAAGASDRPALPTAAARLAAAEAAADSTASSDSDADERGDAWPAANAAFNGSSQLPQQQQLRQRKAGATTQQQQQQPQKHRRPPLAPSRAGTAAGKGPRKQDAGGTNSSSRMGMVKQAAAAAHASSSRRGRWQRRLRRLRHYVRRQLRWWLFCSGELVKLVLNGLLPKQLQPQQQPLQQPPQPGSESPAGVRPSYAGSYSSGSYSSGSCRSECSLPWTPHPAWQQQHQQPVLAHALQQQQQQALAHTRLQLSSSSPSLHAVHASAAGHDGSLDRAVTSPAAAGAGSFSSWHGPAAGHEQQQQALSRSSSNANGLATGGPAFGGSHLSIAPPANRLSGGLPPLQLPAAGDAGGGVGWDGLPSASTAQHGSTVPGSVLGVPVGGGSNDSSSSPSNVLFKWLLRGIVLHEGCRFIQGFLSAEQPLLAPLLLLGGSLAVAGGLPFLLLPASLRRSALDRDGECGGSSSLVSPDDGAAGGSCNAATAVAAAAAAASAGGAAAGAASKAGGKGSKGNRGKQQQQQSPFQAAAGATPGTVSKRPPAPKQQRQDWAGGSAAGAAADALARLVRASSRRLQAVAASVWGGAVQLCAAADLGLRRTCASSFLDTAVSGLIVVGLILGSVLLSAVLLVQIGDESRQAVVSLNALVRQKGTQAGLTQGVWSLVQQYEGQLMGAARYVLQECLPGLTHYVESRVAEFLVRNNMSKVLIDWEVVRAALKLPADCGDDARLRLAVQLANSSLAEAGLGSKRASLAQQLESEQQQLASLASQLEQAWAASSVGDGWPGSSSSSSASSGASSSSSSSSLAHQVVALQASVKQLQEQQQGVIAEHEAVSEQLKLAQLRLHNCQPAGSGSAAVAAAAAGNGFVGSAHQRGLLSGVLGGFSSMWGAADATGSSSSSSSHGDGGQQERQQRAGKAWRAPPPAAGAASHPLGHPLGHLGAHARGVLAAIVHLDFSAAGSEAAALLGRVMLSGEQEQQQQRGVEGEVCAEEAAISSSSSGHEEGEAAAAGLQDAAEQQEKQQGQLEGGAVSSSDADSTCEPLQLAAAAAAAAEAPPPPGSLQAPHAQTCPACKQASAACTCRPLPVEMPGGRSVLTRSTSSSKLASPAAAAAAAAASAASSDSGLGLMRAARGAAYPLITFLRATSSLLLAGLGSTTAVALGAMRLGLGVAKFFVQLGVFASVLYTLLALDIDPVEQLLRLLPLSEASQDRASRAVTKALRGVFVSSLKLAAFHAGFTWLTLRAFGTHFVCTATVASAIVAVLPLVPVALVALPAVLELVLLRAAPVKGLVLLALHLGAYTFGDDLIYREIEPTLPSLVALGVLGGMWHFASPLQGVLLGPMVLALLSVGYSLHREMMV